MIGKEQRKKILYAFLSFLIVGLGQIIEGDSEKGIKYILLFYFALPALFYASLLISGGLFLIVFGVGVIFALIFWVYNIIEAYNF